MRLVAAPTVLWFLLFVSGSPLLASPKPILVNQHDIRSAVGDSEYQLKLKTINREAGTLLIQAIKGISKENAFNQIQKESLYNAAVTRLRQLLSSNSIKLDKQNNYISMLNVISEKNPRIKKMLSDGNHQIPIDAFPFANAARASIQFVDNLQLSRQLLKLINSYQYTAVAEALAPLGQQQVDRLDYALEKISAIQAKDLLNWSKRTSSILPSAKLSIAVKAKDISQINDILASHSTLSIKRHLAKISTTFSTHEQFELFKKASRFKKDASLAIYQIESLDLPDEEKNQFLLGALANKFSGSSAAHVLANRLDSVLVDSLIKALKKNSDFSHQKNLLLTLVLSDNKIFKGEISQISERLPLKPALRKEVAKWND